MYGWIDGWNTKMDDCSNLLSRVHVTLQMKKPKKWLHHKHCSVVNI